MHRLDELKPMLIIRAEIPTRAQSSLACHQNDRFCNKRRYHQEIRQVNSGCNSTFYIICNQNYQIPHIDSKQNALGVMVDLVHFLLEIGRVLEHFVNDHQTYQQINYR
jgi:hypothetical protein